VDDLGARAASRRRAIGILADARRAFWAARRGERTLDQLGLWYGADKSSAGHGFTKIYERYLADRRRSAVTVLEIGVWRGASLRMWRDYFPRGRIFGIDISPVTAAQAGDRVEVFVGDQSDSELLARVVEKTGPLDLVIDDGAHRVEQQVPTLAFLWPHVKPGGLYVVEDTHTSYLESYGMGWRQPGTTIAHLTGYVDDLHRGWHEHAASCPDLAFVHFYAGTCVLGKAEPTNRAPVLARLDAVAARRSGAWTG
jgi:hypothetical protein